MEVFAEFVDVARARGVPFVSMNILCNEQENMERVKSEERGAGKEKLTDAQTLVDLRKKHKLLDASVCDEETAGVEVYHLDLDTTRDSMQQSADKVMEFLKVVAQVQAQL